MLIFVHPIKKFPRFTEFAAPMLSQMNQAVCFYGPSRNKFTFAI